MKFPTLKQCLGGAFMLSALVATPAILRATSANALSPQVSEELNLTPEQQTELDAIRESARTQADSLLTADQLAALDGKTGRDRAQAMRDLDLSEDQRTQLQAIREDSRTAAAQVLTAEQQAQLEELRATRGNRRGGQQGIE